MPRCHRSLALAAWRPRDPFEYGDRTYRNTAIAPVEYNNRTETDRSVIASVGHVLHHFLVCKPIWQ